MTKPITLRISEEIHEALKAEAEEMGVSVNELILLKIKPLEFNGVIK